MYHLKNCYQTLWSDMEFIALSYSYFSNIVEIMMKAFRLEWFMLVRKSWNLELSTNAAMDFMYLQ